MKKADWIPALGFALGAIAAWYWGLGPMVVAFCATAAVGWVLVRREEVP